MGGGYKYSKLGSQAHGQEGGISKTGGSSSRYSTVAASEEVMVP